MSFAFIHAADIHLGRPFSIFSEYECTSLAEISKNAVKKAFENLIDFAIAKEVDFLLIAGDTFDLKESDFESKLILREGLKKLEKFNIKTFLICGNHDPIESYNKNAFNFAEDSVIKIVGLNSKQFDKFIIEDKNSNPIVNLQALSFQTSEFKNNPLEFFRTITFDEKKLFNIALLHCDLDGAQDGIYAPCSKCELESFGFDYCALGHIHTPCCVSDKITYAGTLQGRNSKEDGLHGARFIRVDNGKIIENSFVALDVIRYYDVDIDLSGAVDVVEVYEIVSDRMSTLIEKDDNKTVELFLVRVNFEGDIDFASKINDKILTTISENILETFKNKVLVYKFFNNTNTKIDEDIFKNDDTIAGILYNTIKNENNLDSAFEVVEKKYEKLLSHCGFSSEEFCAFKKEIKETSKKSCLDICNQIYNSCE